MDFIERIFNLSPDGGSGTLELLIFLTPCVVAYWIAARARQRARAHARRQA